MPDINGAQPGEKLFAAAMSGQIDPDRVANFLLRIGPALPHESAIPFVPRFLIRGGFQDIPAAPTSQPAPQPWVAAPPASMPAATAQVIQPAVPTQPAARPRPIPTVDYLGQPGYRPVTGVRRITQL